MTLQPSAEQPHATGTPGTFGQPRAVDPRARFQIPVIPATFFADDLNIKSAESATLPSRPRASCSQPALLRVSYCQRLQTSSASRCGMPPPRPPAGRGARARRPRQKSSLIFQHCRLSHAAQAYAAPRASSCRCPPLCSPSPYRPCSPGYNPGRSSHPCLDPAHHRLNTRSWRSPPKGLGKRCRRP